MTRHTGSINRLKGIAAPLAAFAALHPPGGSSRRRGGDVLPPPLQLAALRGEAVLRQRFFGALGKQFPHDPTPEQWLDYWQRFVVKRGAIADLARRAHLHRASGLAQLPDAHDDETCFVLYCALLDALQMTGDEALLLVAVDKFFVHLWRQQFPDGPREVERKNSVEALQNRVQIASRRRYGPLVRIRESFQQTPDRVHFRLLAQCPNQPAAELAEVERTRLKLARLAAYEAALCHLTDGAQSDNCHDL